MAIKKEQTEDKMIRKPAEDKEFFFPDYQITVKATSIEEAEKKVKAMQSKKSNQ